MTPQEDDELIERLLAPAYWMSGSSDGHEGENDAPREAAARLTEVRAERDALLEKPINLAKMDSINDEDGTPEKMVAYYWHEQANEARAERDALREEIERKDEALRKCRDKFAEYAVHHRREAKSQGQNGWLDAEKARIAKAKANQAMAEICEAVLNHKGAAS
jgi:hypothetical protein